MLALTLRKIIFLRFNKKKQKKKQAINSYNYSNTDKTKKWVQRSLAWPANEVCAHLARDLRTILCLPRSWTVSPRWAVENNWKSATYSVFPGRRQNPRRKWIKSRDENADDTVRWNSWQRASYPSSFFFDRDSGAAYRSADGRGIITSSGKSCRSGERLGMVARV